MTDALETAKTKDGRVSAQALVALVDGRRLHCLTGVRGAEEARHVLTVFLARVEGTVPSDPWRVLGYETGVVVPRESR